MEKTRMTPNLFTTIKTLIASGSTSSQVSEYLKVSLTTVGRVRQSESWEEYKQIIAAINAKCRERYAKKAEEKANEPEPVQKAEAPKKAPTAWDKCVDTYIQNRGFAMMQEQNELLKSISAKLAFLVEQLS